MLGAAPEACPPPKVLGLDCWAAAGAPKTGGVEAVPKAGALEPVNGFVGAIDAPAEAEKMKWTDG